MKVKIILMIISFGLISCSPNTTKFYFINGKIGLKSNENIYINQVKTSRDIHSYVIYEKEVYNNDSIDIRNYVNTELDSIFKSEVEQNGFYITISLKKKGFDEIYDQHDIRLNLSKDSIINSYPVRI